MSLPPLGPTAPTAATPQVPAVGGAGPTTVVAADAATLLGTPGDTAPAAPLPDPVRAAVEVARTAAATRQAGLAPLLANLTQALASPGLPNDLRAAIAQVLALQTPTAGPITAETIRQAVAQSGLFLEARLARTDRGRDPPPDLKAVLLALGQVLASAEPKAPHGPLRPAARPPPVRDGALQGQPAERASLPAGADPQALVHELRGEVEQAVARQTLHQLASLPDPAARGWMFELPLATPQGAAIAQFEIDRDDAAQAHADAGPVWRARFSLDIEPLGPVHVHLRMDGQRTAATVWAEHDGGLERLRGQGEALARALPGEVVFHPGSPRRPEPPAPGRFVDQTS